MSESILSVGIDIGTTTTHMVLSRLSIDTISIFNRLPENSIAAREIVYQSPITFTPIVYEGENRLIDFEKISLVLEDFYRQAKIDKNEIESGALIVTGDSARTDNAQKVAQALAQAAGNFVVETAGPKLEGILAARGSGAVEESYRTGKTICNVDIGGGTTNLAFIEKGRIVETACLNLGGRLIQVEECQPDLFNTEQFETEQFKTVQCNRSGRILLQSLGLSASAPLSKTDLSKLATKAAALIAEYCRISIKSGEETSLLESLSETDVPSLAWLEKVDEYWFTGGVGTLMKSQDRQDTKSEKSSAVPFGDLGQMLARALLDLLDRKRARFDASGIYATVIGAGLHTMQVSGSTIGIQSSQSILPLRNVRILKISAEQNAKGYLTAQVTKQLNFLDQLDGSEPLALYINDLSRDDISYRGIKNLAAEISNLLERLPKVAVKNALVIVLKEDIAMSLSQILKGMLRDKIILTIDGIDAQNGDFMDLGKTLGSAIDPNCLSIGVVIKTLLFYK
jgi:ethanolamine utilization protein EutA